MDEEKGKKKGLWSKFAGRKDKTVHDSIYQGVVHLHAKDVTVLEWRAEEEKEKVDIWEEEKARKYEYDWTLILK